MTMNRFTALKMLIDCKKGVINQSDPQIFGDDPASLFSESHTFVYCVLFYQPFPIFVQMMILHFPQVVAQGATEPVTQSTLCMLESEACLLEGITAASLKGPK